MECPMITLNSVDEIQRIELKARKLRAELMKSFLARLGRR